MHSSRRWAATAAALVVLTAGTRASAQVTGPSFPPPGGANFSAVGSAVSAPGREGTYSVFDNTQFGSLFWSLTTIANPFVSGPGGISAPGTMNFAGIDFTGTALFSSGNPMQWIDALGHLNSVTVFFNVQIHPAGSADAHTASGLAWTNAGSAGIATLPNVWPVFDVGNNPGNNFDVWTEYTVGTSAAGGGQSLDAFYDAHSNQIGAQYNVSSAAGFYSTPPVTATPEPATLALLATGLAGLGGTKLRFRRKQLAAV